jgi:hypothetical protein
LLLLCLYEAWKRGPRKKLVALTFASGLACALIGGFVFKLALSNVTHEERTESYWGGKYGVFYEKGLRPNSPGLDHRQGQRHGRFRRRTA